MIEHNSNPKRSKDSEIVINNIDLVFKKPEDKVGKSFTFDFGEYKAQEIIANDIRRYYPPYTDMSNLYVVLTDIKGDSRNLKFEKLFNKNEAYLNEMYGEVSDMKREIYSLRRKLEPTQPK